MNMNPELIAKAKEAKSAEELIMIVKEAGIEMTTEQAEEILAQINELSDEDLAAVAGGSGYPGGYFSWAEKNRGKYVDPLDPAYGYGRGTREP